MAEGEAYVCSLSEMSVRRAKEELNEDPKERLIAVQTFRDWIEQQPHITCQTDTLFLLRFLRVAKFSQLRARELIEGYLIGVLNIPEWFNDIDTHCPRMQAFMKSGCATILGFDDEGRQVILVTLGRLVVDGKKYDKHALFRTMMAHFYNCFLNENQQVNGSVHIFDMTGYSLKHQTFVSIDDIRKGVRILQRAFPARLKEFHLYNIGLFESLYKLVSPMLRKKFRDRIHIHSTLEGLYKHISMSLLPVEYLPDDYTGPSAGSIDDISEKMIAEVSSAKARQWILNITNADLFSIDLTKKPLKQPQESFRKINV